MIGRRLTVHVLQRQCVWFKVVLRALSGAVDHDRFLPFVRSIQRGTPQYLFPYRNSIRIHSPILVRPIEPARESVRMRSLVVPCLGERISPMDHGPGVRGLENANVRIPALLVGHRFAIARSSASHSPGFEEFIRIPFAVFRHPRRDVVCALPEDEAHRGPAEAHNDIRIGPHTPHAIPGRRVREACVHRPERSGPGWSGREYGVRDNVSFRPRDRGEVLPVLFGGSGSVQHSDFIETAVQRVLDWILRMTDPCRK